MKGHTLEDIAKPPTRGEILWYKFVRNTITLFTRVFWRAQIIGRENIPATGPWILSAVHRSNIDTPIVCAITTRRLRYMGKESLWGKYRLADKFFDALGGFPVNRGTADRDALRKCQTVLENGEPLVMFPEGTRQSGDVVQELYDGPSFVACRTGAPILPIGIAGAEDALPTGTKMLRPVKLVMVVGEPIPAPPIEPGARPTRRQVKEHTALLRTRIQEEFDRARAIRDGSAR